MGGVNIAFAILDCLRGIKSKCHGDYVVLMSESDYPVKSNSYIESTLRNNPMDYVTITRLPHPNPLHTPGGHWLEGGRRRLECYPVRLQAKSIATIEPRVLDFGNLRQFVKVLKYNPQKIKEALDIWLHYPTRKHPCYIQPCGGDLWFILRMNTVTKILAYMDEHPDYLEYCKGTTNLDEIFIPTLINKLIPNEERMNKTLRYIHWKNNGASSPENLTLKETDIINRCIAQPDCLFVRKVDDLEVCKYIDNAINE